MGMSSTRDRMSTLEAGPVADPTYLDFLAPWIGTSNLGDLIIRDSVVSWLAAGGILPNAIHSSQFVPARGRRDLLSGERPIIVGGTNLLPFRMKGDAQFPLPAVAKEQLKSRLVLFGVGWRRYSDTWGVDPEGTTAAILSREFPHGVRDSYTRNKLAEIGIPSTLIGCPTLWSIPRSLREFDGGVALVTLTDYSPQRTRDRALLDYVRRNFDRAYLQPLGPADARLAVQEHCWDARHVLPCSLKQMSRFLAEERPVYVGTRLHGGIRAMQQGLPAAIVEIDCRAAEMGRDFGLHTCEESLKGLDTAVQAATTAMPTGVALARDAGTGYLADLAGRLIAGANAWDDVMVPRSGGRPGFGSNMVQRARRTIARIRGSA